MKEIESTNCIIVFLDILGYKSWVKDAKSPDEIFSVLEGMFNDILKMKEKYPKAKEYFEYLEFTIWSDSLIFVVNLNDVEKDKQKDFLSWFLYFLSLFIVNFVGNTGYFLRGAVTYGDFIQKKILNEENRFIFSKAFIKAVEMEKEACNPRLLLEDEFVQFARKEDLLNGLTELTIFKDMYQKHYLDYYGCFHWIPRSIAEFHLKNVKEKLSPKVSNIKEEKVKEKYFYFFNYHNNHVYELFQAQLTDEDFKKLDLDKADVLKQLQYLGIAENDGEFCIKRDVAPNKAELIARLNYSNFGDKSSNLAQVIIDRIEGSNTKIKEYLISL